MTEKNLQEKLIPDTFVCSSWYYLRFCSPKNSDYGYDINDINYWMPVDQYIGGVEHAILHLLYSVFYGRYHMEMKILISLNLLKVYLHKEWFAMKHIKIR